MVAQEVAVDGQYAEWTQRGIELSLFVYSVLGGKVWLA